MEEYLLENEESKEDDIEFREDILNYRGYFVENGDEEEKKFYEYGAHFPYMYLYQRLEILAQERKSNKKALEAKLEKREKETNKKESIEDPATNEESKPNENLKDLLSIFKQKGKSRNRGDVDIGLTYMPKMNRKKEEQSNAIDNMETGLIKSSAGQKEEKKNNNKNIKNMKKNNLTRNEELIGANLKYNNYMNKKEKNSNNFVAKKIKSGNPQSKVRKRNENKIWNINNSLNGNITISLNILNKTKLGEKNNSKNMTHDIPYMTKITNNLVNKLKSIQYSKEKLRNQILNTGNAEQHLNKKAKANKIINKFRNLNNKGSYSNYYGYQNTKNTSSSKNMINNPNNMKKVNKIGIAPNAKQINEKLVKKKANMKNNIISRNILNNNNNNKLIKQNNFLSNLKNNNNKNKNIYNINKNLLKKNNNNKTSKNNISINNNSNNNNNINNNQNQKNKIPNNNNYKTVLLEKENNKLAALNKNQYEFLDNISSKKNKNNISRNNIPIFNKEIQNSVNKNFHSVNNQKKKNIKPKANHVNINLTNNFNNLYQQPKTQLANKMKEINYKYNKNCSSNINLKKYSPGKPIQKKSNDYTNNKRLEAQKRKNINNIQEQLKSYLLKVNNAKNNINLNKAKKIGNKSTYKNNGLINLDNNINKNKNIVSRNREGENSNINADKNTTKKNNTMMQNKKKHHININININNQQNIILNKLANGLNNNSFNICSVRSSDQKEVNNNKMEKKNKNIGNYFI